MKRDHHVSALQSVCGEGRAGYGARGRACRVLRVRADCGGAVQADARAIIEFLAWLRAIASRWCGGLRAKPSVADLFVAEGGSGAPTSRGAGGAVQLEEAAWDTDEAGANAALAGVKPGDLLAGSRGERR